jgi:hypothetical protein
MSERNQRREYFSGSLSFPSFPGKHRVAQTYRSPFSQELKDRIVKKGNLLQKYGANGDKVGVNLFE